MLQLFMPMYDHPWMHWFLMKVDLLQQHYVVYDSLSHCALSVEEAINGAA